MKRKGWYFQWKLNKNRFRWEKRSSNVKIRPFWYTELPTKWKEQGFSQKRMEIKSIETTIRSKRFEKGFSFSLEMKEPLLRPCSSKAFGMYWLVYREHFPYSLPALVQLWHYRVCSSHKEQTGCGARNERSKEKPTLENTPMKCVCGRWPLLWWNPRRAAQYGIDLALPVVMNWRAFSKFFSVSLTRGTWGPILRTVMHHNVNFMALKVSNF